MDAEYIACAEAAKEAMWIRNFINDLRIPGVHIDTVPLYIDNNAALKLTRNPEFHSRAKHIDVKHNFIREKVEEGLIDTQRVNTKDNLADVFTKALPRSTHEDLGDELLVQLRERYAAYHYYIYLPMYIDRVPLPKRTLSLAEACRGLCAVVIFMLPSWRAALKPLRCFSEVQDSFHCLGP
ncbi:hypothetical protein PENANT_c064G07894 [Penicillium antarcticum]|uniref:Reverse transcriptase Ty1/copia-type domain-containing protein n=1 Tax=Penicillium antarcticum TaxID=416450 RepID=A0A1V6PRA7_9EURO|nr:hypothetical protein PENANT_c064G07894 [Penicillium antarcticum]